MESILLFQHFHISECSQNQTFRSFHNFTTNNHFIQDPINFIKIKYNIQFTHISKILVQYFDEQMDYLNFKISKMQNKKYENKQQRKTFIRTAKQIKYYNEA